jgi:Zn-dependent alcohol dehydrogenase
VTAGESVAVFGIGGLGFHAVQLLNMIGASPIIAIDPIPKARERALSLGADITFAYKRNQVLGHYGSEPFHTQQLVDLIRDGRLDLSGSVSEIMPLENVLEALDRLENKINNPIRIVIKP